MLSEQVTVLGGGALGLLLSAKLAGSGQAARLLTRTREQAQAVNEAGVIWKPMTSDEPKRAWLQAAAFAEAGPGDSGLVLVALKQTALTDEMLSLMERMIAEDAVLVLFQNGIGHMERLATALPGRTLLAAVTTEGALRTGLTAVAHTGAGETWVGPWHAPTRQTPEEGDKWRKSALQVIQMLEKAGFTAFLSNNMDKRILRKLLINAVINPLTALWRVPNGELPNSPDRLNAMQSMFRETVRILRFHGGLPDSADADASLWETVLEVCAATAANRSSMLQDVLAGRETEIDAMNGAVCRMAAEIGVPAPWNEAVTTLVKAIR